MNISKNFLLELAKICNSVYASPINQNKLTIKGEPLKFQKIIHGSMGRGFCRLFWNDNFIVIAFRGTREMIDWRISNLQFLPTKLKNCEIQNNIKVHYGFQNALYYMDKTTGLKSIESLFLHLEENDLFNDKRRIIITGHSLGGAIATLFSVKLRYKYKDLIDSNLDNIILFGSPAVGLKKFKEYYGSLSSKTIRIINGLDIVPFTPPLFFHHVGESLWYREKNILKNLHWFKRILYILKLPLGHFIKDHSMKRYIKTLNSME